MARGKSGRRGEVKPTDPPPIEKSVLFGPDHLDKHDYHSQPSLEKVIPDYKDALASVADRYVAKSSKPQTQPAPDQPQPDLQTPDKSSEALPVSPSPKPQAGRARRLASGQWVTP